MKTTIFTTDHEHFHDRESYWNSWTKISNSGRFWYFGHNFFIQTPNEVIQNSIEIHDIIYKFYLQKLA